MNMSLSEFHEEIEIFQEKIKSVSDAEALRSIALEFAAKTQSMCEEARLKMGILSRQLDREQFYIHQLEGMVDLSLKHISH